MFQSAPAIAGGRCPRRRRARAVRAGFNPRPPLLAGDASGELTWAWVYACFNPRPPLLAGDAALREAVAVDDLVSIRARH